MKSELLKALGRLTGKAYRIDGWLEQLVRELDRELRGVNSECEMRLSGLGYNEGLDNYVEILVRCKEQDSMIVRVYVDFIEYVRVLNAKVEEATSGWREVSEVEEGRDRSPHCKEVV